MAWHGWAEKVTEQKKPNVIRLLNLGHSIEYHALKLLEQIPGYEVKFKQQVVSLFRLPSGRLVEGSVDAVLWSDTERGVIDIKSVGSRYTQGFSDTWDEDLFRLSRMQSVKQIDEQGFWVEDPVMFLAELGEHALVSNISQVNAYAHADFFKERNITFASIIRYCKNKSRMMEVRFKPSQELFDKLVKKYSFIEEAVVKQKNPNLARQDFALGSMACAYCPYQSQCYPGASKREAFASAPKKAWATRVNDMEGANELRGLFGPYLQGLQNNVKTEQLEKAIITELNAHQVTKVKLDDGQVFEVATLKSPKPHQKLRRAKE